MMSAWTRLRCAAGLTGALLILTPSPGFAPLAAETAGKKVTHRSQPAHAAQSAPDRTGSLAKPQTGTAENPSVAVAVEHDTVPEPVYLPDVPRTRMRACGEIWREKKMTGDVGDGDWRDFAFKCLAAETKAGHD